MSEPIENPDRQFQRDVLGVLSSLQTNVSSLQTNVSSLQTNVSSLQTNVSGLQTSVVDSIQRVVADQTRLRVEVMARIDRLQTTIELVREDARVNWATADTALSRVKNYREEIDHLTAIITAMERRHQTLAAAVDELRDRKANGK
jgi:chromosome segregation ATPase